MATYSEIFNLWATDSVLKNKVIVSCVTSAQTIFNEAVGVTNHAERLVWANKVLANPTNEAQRMLWGVCLNSTVQTSGAGIADASLQTVVDGLVNFFALH
jgi:hypothetical protein